MPDDPTTAKLVGMLDTLAENLLKHSQETAAAFAQQRQETAAGFEETRAGFERVEQRLGHVERRLGNIETRVEGLETRVEGLETEVRVITRNHEKRISALEGQ